jgi:hypothetical protein
MFLPLALLAGWAFRGAHPTPGARTQTWTATLRPYAPYAILLIAYLAIDLSINSRNYFVAGATTGLGATSSPTHSNTSSRCTWADTILRTIC